MRRSLTESVKKALGFLAELLFPRSCVGCGEYGSFLCDHCVSVLPKKTRHQCPFCSEATPFGETCLRCSKQHLLDGLFSAVSFRENDTVAEAIHVLKYEFVDELAEPLGRFLAEAASLSELPLPDMLVPVPLHPWRYRFRGFNQSSLIARSMSECIAPHIPLPVREDIIIRKRFTLPQARNHKVKDRKENLSGAFSLMNQDHAKKVISGKTIWLIDDVATTGSTLEECAKVLKKAGAKKVWGVVVAR